MAVTLFDGSVQLLKMPEILDPMQNVDPLKQASIDGTGTPDNSMANLMPGGHGSAAEINFVSVKANLDNVELKSLELSIYLIATIAKKEIAKFSDPFKYDEPPSGFTGESNEPTTTAKEAVDLTGNPVEHFEFKQILNKRMLDTEKGDAGKIL